MVIQFKRIASAPKSNPIVGRAILTDVPMNGVKKEAMLATKSAAIFTLLLTLKELSAGFIHSPDLLVTITEQKNKNKKVGKMGG